MNKNLFLGLTAALILILTTGRNANAQQGLSVNTSGNPAAPSAMLDVSSSTKGALLPRMTQSERTSISSPADGLIVYQTDGVKGLYVYNLTTTTWVHAAAVADVGTQKIGLTAIPGTATTAMRSDAAPALDQDIAPTWGGLHTFTKGVTTTGTDAISISADGVATTVNVASGSGVKTVTVGSTTGASATTIQSGSGNMQLNSSNGSMTLSSGTGAVNISNDATNTTVNVGTGAGVKNVTVGSTNTTSATKIQSGTGGVDISNDAIATNVNVGNGAANKTVTVGSTNGTSTTTIQSGSGAVNVNNNNNQATNINTGTSTGAVNIGGSADQAINVGTGAANKTVRVGSTTGTSATVINSGSGSVNINNDNNQVTNINTGTSTGAVNLGNGTGGVNVGGDQTIAEGKNIVTGTTTGTKIGTATSQKIGFYNATPVTQRTGDIATALSTLGLVASPTIDLTATGTSILPGANGGTGVANTGKTITVGGNVNMGGAFTTTPANDVTLTTAGATNVTLPTSGTLAGKENANSWTALQTFANGVTTTGTDAINISADASATTVNVGTGGAAKTVTVGSTTGTSGTTINSGSGAVNINNNNNQATNINTGSSTGAVNVGNASAGAVTVQSGGSVGVTAGTSLNLASSGGAVNINNLSNQSTNINAGTSTGAVNLGNAASGAVTVQSGSAIGVTAGTTVGLTAGSTMTIASGSGAVSVNNNVNQATNINTGTSTGAVNVGGSSASLGFYGATAITKPSGDVATALSNLGLVTTPTIGVASITGTLPIAKGGTNSNTALTGSGSIMVNNGTSIIQGDAGTSTTVLHGNASGVPTYGAVNLTTDVTGTLPASNGGTGITSLGAGIPTFLGTASSANLATAVTDETGSGALVFANTPTLVTPVLGAATATSINGLAISTTTGTLTVANSKTLTANNSITIAGTDGKSLNVNSNLTLSGSDGKTLGVLHSISLAGTDGTTMTFPSTSATIARTDAAQTFTGVQTMTAPVINGHPTIEGITPTGATGTGKMVFSASPDLTGVPTAPTATGGTNTTQIATTAFVQNATTSNFATPATISVNLAAPTAGVATTAMRSDATLQLDQAITPTWTGAHIFQGGVTTQGTNAVNISADAVATTINIGTGAGAKNVTVGSTNTTSSITIQSGSGSVRVNENNNQATYINTGSSTGDVWIGSQANQTLEIGSYPLGGNSRTVNLGSPTASSTTSIRSGSGGVNINADVNQPTNINTGSSTGTVTIGGTGAQTINVGNNASGVKTVTVGGTAGASSTTIQSGATGATTITSGSGGIYINRSVDQATSINTGSSTGNVNIGSGTGSQAIGLTSGSGAVNINVNNNQVVNINTGASAGFVNVGSASSSIGFYGATAITKPSGDVATALSNLGLITSPTIVATTNANLTGPITSVGNATSVASQTGTGTKFVMDNTPTLITPILGVATATSINGLTIDNSTGTLRIADGVTLEANANVTIEGSLTTSGTFHTADDFFVAGSFSAPVSQPITLNADGVAGSNVTLPASGTLATTANVSTAVSDKVPNTRTVSTTAPLTGGGALSGNLTLSMPAAATGTDGYLTQTDWNTFNSKVATSRTINTTSPLSGGGDLSANRTISIANAAADGSTKGAASFTASDFNDAAGNISIDYTNGQAASGSTKGFLTSADWNTFNDKLGTDVTTLDKLQNIGTNATGDVTVGSTAQTAKIQSGSGGINLNSDNSQPTNINTGTSTGVINIGGGESQTLNIGNGATGGNSKTVHIGSITGASPTNINSGTNGVNINVNNSQPTNINTGTSTGTVNIGNSNSSVKLSGNIIMQSAGVTVHTTSGSITAEEVLQNRIVSFSFGAGGLYVVTLPDAGDLAAIGDGGVVAVLISNVSTNGTIDLRAGTGGSLSGSIIYVGNSFSRMIYIRYSGGAYVVY